MKKLALILFLGVGDWAGAATVPEFLLQNYHAGPVSVNMTPAEAAKQYPANRVKRWDPYKGVHVIDVFASSDQTAEPALRMNLDRDQKYIWAISVSDKRYRTAKGIGIGSTFGALRKAHPRLNARTEEGEMDRFIVVEILGDGISCVLQYDDATWKKMLAQPNRRDVPVAIIPDTKIIESISLLKPPPPPANSKE